MLKYLKNFIPLRASISINENFMSQIWENSEEGDLNDLWILNMSVSPSLPSGVESTLKNKDGNFSKL